MRRLLTGLAALLMLASGLAAVPAAAAAGATLTGTLTINQKVALSPNAVALFMIVGQSANPGAGGIVGYQRIDNASTPVPFAVAYDPASIDQSVSYAIFGSIIDGSTVYQTF